MDGGGHYGNCRSSCPGGPSVKSKGVKSVADIEPDEDGNYLVGDMFMQPEQFQEKFGKGGTPLSGIAGDRYRWDNGGNQRNNKSS